MKILLPISIGCLFCFAMPFMSNAQSFPLYTPEKLAIIDREALFNQSKFGKKLQQKFKEERQILIKENNALESELEAEEKDLTLKRKTLKTEEFQKLAQAFDEKVNTIRKAQIAKETELKQRITQAPADFFIMIAPILSEFIKERKIELVLDHNAVLFGRDQMNITKAAIQRIDNLLQTN